MMGAVMVVGVVLKGGGERGCRLSWGGVGEVRRGFPLVIYKNLLLLVNPKLFGTADCTLRIEGTFTRHWNNS